MLLVCLIMFGLPALAFFGLAWGTNSVTSSGLGWSIATVVWCVIIAHLIVTGAEKDTDSYDYFTWSEALLDRCIEYLNRPGLVDGIHRLIANP